jgi:hypothetical protein
MHSAAGGLTTEQLLNTEELLTAEVKVGSVDNAVVGVDFRDIPTPRG